MKVRINENSRISTLNFDNLKDFCYWLEAQSFNEGESIEFLTQV